MAPKLAAMDTWRSHATVGIGLAVPGRPIGPWSRRTGAPEASATGRDRASRVEVALVRAGSARHREAAVRGGHERSRWVPRNHRSSRPHVSDLHR